MRQTVLWMMLAGALVGCGGPEGKQGQVVATPPADLRKPAPTPPATRPAATPPAQRQPDEGHTTVVAASVLQVNDQFITIEDILLDARQSLKALPEGISEKTFRVQAGQIVREVLQRRVMDMLVGREAERRLTEEQKALIDKQLQAKLREWIADLGGGSKAKLEQVLRAEGTTLDRATENYRKALTVRRHLDVRFAPAVSVNRTMLWDYYRAHPEEFSLPKKVQMQMIAAPIERFLPPGADSPSAVQRAAARAKAKELIVNAAKELQAGKDFAEVARRLSRGLKGPAGGVWPLMQAGSLREVKVEDAAFRLVAGRRSDIIETQTGYYIVKAMKVVPGKVTRFEDAQEKIERTLRDRQFRKLTDEHFRRLTERATIVQSEHFAEYVLDRAVARFWRK